MSNDENFMQVLQYQKLKYSLERQGLIKSDNTAVVYVLIAFCSGLVVGSILPW